jgi:hypothetical protein
MNINNLANLSNVLAKNSIRLAHIFHLATMTACDTLPRSLKDALCDDTSDVAEPQALGFSLEEPEYPHDELVEHGKLGYLIHVETPVPRDFEKLGTIYNSSWGCYTSKYFYADDLETCIQMAVTWQATYLQEMRNNAHELEVSTSL